jgi:membrane-bound lytic murein transglycosylase D
MRKILAHLFSLFFLASFAQEEEVHSIYSSTKPSTSSAKNTSNNSTYTVKSGDSLYTIAKKFPGVSVENIKKWNDISGNNIQPGMKLKIKG